MSDQRNVLKALTWRDSVKSRYLFMYKTGLIAKLLRKNFIKFSTLFGLFLVVGQIALHFNGRQTSDILKLFLLIAAGGLLLSIADLCAFFTSGAFRINRGFLCIGSKFFPLETVLLPETDGYAEDGITFLLVEIRDIGAVRLGFPDASDVSVFKAAFESR